MDSTLKNPLESRLDLFKFDLSKNTILDKKEDSDKIAELTTLFSTLYTEKKGDWTAIKADLTEANGFKPEMVQNLTFTHALSEWSKDNENLVKVFQKDDATMSMRDIALKKTTD